MHESSTPKYDRNDHCHERIAHIYTNTVNFEIRCASYVPKSEKTCPNFVQIQQFAGAIDELLCIFSLLPIFGLLASVMASELPGDHAEIIAGLSACGCALFGGADAHTKTQLHMLLVTKKLLSTAARQRESQ
jgi:hypothetical protein